MSKDKESLNNELVLSEFEQVSKNNSKSKKTKKKKSKNNIPYEQEVLRKGIHLVSLSIPLIYIFVPKTNAIIILFVMALIAVLVDILSKRETIFKEIINKYFGAMLRSHEKHKKKIILNGASWVLIASFLTVLLFPKIIAITALCILIVSDISAALIGRKFGQHKVLKKSWEGTAAFAISACLVVIILGTIFAAPWTYFAVGFIAGIVAAFIELISKALRIDDNVSIPMSVGSVYMAFTYIFNFANMTYNNLL